MFVPLVVRCEREVVTFPAEKSEPPQIWRLKCLPKFELQIGSE